MFDAKTIFWTIIAIPLHCFLPGLLSTFVGFCVGVMIIGDIIHMFHIKPDGKAILITGCDTGFGHALALRLHSLGYYVIAACLFDNGAGWNALNEAGIQTVKLDVTSDEDVDRVKQEVEATIVKKGIVLWGVVNNAGVNGVGDTEFVLMKSFQFLMDVNFFGTVRVSKAFLPLLRKSQGRLVNVTSVQGRIAFKGTSAYGATKWAGEGFSDCLRCEMHRFGVKVSIVEPGCYGGATGMLSEAGMARLKKELDQMWEAATPELKRAYGRESFDTIPRVFKYMAMYETATDISPVVNAMTDALCAYFPRARYEVGGDGNGVFDKYFMLVHLRDYLPTWIFDIVAYLFFNRSLPLNTIDALYEKKIKKS